MSGVSYAMLSAAAAAVTAILAKIGVEGVPANLAYAVRTAVVIVFAWLMVFIAGEHHKLGAVSRRSLVFLALSGLATGLSWLAYFRALQLSPASRVAPIDKLSLPLTVILATIFLGESIDWKLGLGVTLMTLGALLTIS